MGKHVKKMERNTLSSKKNQNRNEDLARYFLAAIGLLIVVLIVVGVLGFFKII
jgi:hypothetical protein